METATSCSRVASVTKMRTTKSNLASFKKFFVVVVKHGVQKAMMAMKEISISSRTSRRRREFSYCGTKRDDIMPNCVSRLDCRRWLNLT